MCILCPNTSHFFYSLVLLGDGNPPKDSSDEETDDQEPDDFEQRILKDVKASRATSLRMDENVASAEGILFAYDEVDSDDDNVRTYPNKKSRLSDRAQQMAAFVSEAVI